MKCLSISFKTYGKPSDVLFLKTSKLPNLNPGEVLVKFLASPMNPADINQIQGVYPSKPTFDADSTAVAGNEGLVEIIESKGTRLRSGDWGIMNRPGIGTWRNLAVLNESLIFPVDRTGLTPVQVGTVSVNPCTAFRMLKDFVKLEKGDWFIQNGANSGVGRAAIQLARIWGLKSINVVRDRPDIDQLRAELKGLGATQVVTDAEISTAKFRKSMQEWTGGKGVPLALNCVGGKNASNLAGCLSEGGWIVTYGAMAKEPLLLSAGQLIFKDIHAGGFWVSAWGDKHPKEKLEMVNEILELTRSGQFKDIPFEEVSWSKTSESELEEALLKSVEKSMQGFVGKKQILVE